MAFPAHEVPPSFDLLSRFVTGNFSVCLDLLERPEPDSKCLDIRHREMEGVHKDVRGWSAV
jgi:hypothetical protein